MPESVDCATIRPELANWILHRRPHNTPLPIRHHAGIVMAIRVLYSRGAAGKPLLNQSNLLVAEQGANFSFKDMLFAARDRVAKRFVGQPLTVASIPLRLGGLYDR
jgi:hypothetical protein